MKFAQITRLIFYIFSTIVFFIVYISDWNGIASYTDKASSDALNSIFASEYENQNRDEIIVIIATDATLNTNRLRLPIDFDFHQTVISKIASLQPKVLMVDYVFDRVHEIDPKGHIKLEEDLNALNFPVFLATNSNSLTPVDDLIIKSSQTIKPVSVVNFLSFTKNNLYCRYFEPLRYNPTSSCTNDNNIDKTIPSASWAIYKYLCGSSSDDTNCKNINLENEAKPFRVMWGGEPSLEYRYLPNQKKCTQRSKFDLFGTDDELWSSDCSFNPTISVRELFCLSNAKTANNVMFFDNDKFVNSNTDTNYENSDPLCPKPINGKTRLEIANSLKDKIFIYAGFFGVNADVIRPPTTGPIPGAHFHAMALDNLMTFKGSPKSDNAMILGFHISSQIINITYFILCLGLSLGLYYFLIVFRFAEDEHEPEYLRSVIVMIFIIFFSFLYIAICFKYFGLAPANWIGGVITGVIAPKITNSILHQSTSLLGYIYKKSLFAFTKIKYFNRLEP